MCCKLKHALLDVSYQTEYPTRVDDGHILHLRNRSLGHINQARGKCLTGSLDLLKTTEEVSDLLRYFYHGKPSRAIADI